ALKHARLFLESAVAHAVLGVVGRVSSARGAALPEKVRGLDLRQTLSRRADRGGFDRVGELAHVAAPFGGGDRTERAGRELDTRQPMILDGALAEMAREQRQVLAPLT